MHAGFTGAWDPEMPHAVRQHEVDHIAWEISFRSDLDGVPAVVQDFLFGPWCKVLAHVRHRPALEASGESLRFERAVDDERQLRESVEGVQSHGVSLLDLVRDTN